MADINLCQQKKKAMSSISNQSYRSRRPEPTAEEQSIAKNRLRLLPLALLLVLSMGLLLTGLTGAVVLPRELYAAGSILLSVSILHQLRLIQEAQ